MRSIGGQEWRLGHRVHAAVGTRCNGHILPWIWKTRPSPQPKETIRRVGCSSSYPGAAMVAPGTTLGEPTMAKPNVHTASRDELVEAGIRAELADEILKRRRKGKIDLETLDEVPGIGPATLEQLRKALDFRDPPKNGDDR